MITGGDVYQVLSALVPIYVAMALAFGSVRWFKIFTPPQCAGINSFVAVFCVPFLSFSFINTNNLYTMNFTFLAADTLQKLAVLVVLIVLASFDLVSIEWLVTLFSLITLPNTLVIGVPLLTAMYGDYSADLMVQIVVLQSVIWYTLLIFLFEYRAAMIFIRARFPENADRIASIRVESDVISMSGRGEEEVEADADVSLDGKVHVTVRRSTSVSSSSRHVANSSFDYYYYNNNNSSYYRSNSNNNNCGVPRASNLSGVEIYSTQTTPRGSSFSSLPGNFPDGYCARSSNFDGGDVTGKNINNNIINIKGGGANLVRSSSTNTPYKKGVFGSTKDLHMYGWSPSKLSVVTKAASYRDPASRLTLLPELLESTKGSELAERMSHAREINGELKESVVLETAVNETGSDIDDEEKGQNGNKKSSNMPPVTVLIRLILVMVWRKIIRNPNTYGSTLGLIWALISFRWNVEMPLIVDKSIKIISNTSLGMSVFSLGLFMALQPKFISCGKKMALMALGLRFFLGPLVIGVASAVIGLRGDILRISIIQATLPQGIVPFVFAKEYGVHPDILSTGVIFGLILALPITIIYYIILGLV